MWQAQSLMFQVSNGIKVCKPYMPDFAISHPLEVEIADQIHTMVSGPYTSADIDDEDLFPYTHRAGKNFYDKEYKTYLVSNGRVMN